MQKIRLGVIGTGMAWEKLHYPALKELSDKYEIVALANDTRAKAVEYARNMNLDESNVYSDYRELLERDDVDVVDIILPIPLNYEASEKAAKAGKDIICEKPLAPNIPQAEAYRNLPGKYGVRVMISENMRYSEETNKMREIVHAGKIGRVVYFMFNNINCFPCEMISGSYASTEWRRHPDFEGGAFLDAGVHDMAVMRHIFGPVESVQAYGVPQEDEYNPYLSVNTNIKFKNGIIGQYAYFPSGKEMQRPLVGFRIFGTKGMIYLEEKSSGVINIAYNDGTAEKEVFTPGRGFYNELLNFYNAYMGREQISVTPEIEFGDVKMVFDILQSVEKGVPVKVD